MEGDATAFEIGVVLGKQRNDEADDCIQVLVNKFEEAGLVVYRDFGLHHQFIKLGAPLEILGKAAAKLHFKKRTRIGVDLQFDWEELEAFIRQPDGSLFSWCESFYCYRHIIYGIMFIGLFHEKCQVNKEDTVITLKYDDKKVYWEPGEPLFQKLETEGIVKEVFPLHDEKKKKKLLKHWAVYWWDFTHQPIDEIYSYFGMKVATYFAFLGMYARWLLFPAALGFIVQRVDFGALQLLVLPAFFLIIISWAVLFFQFWKRKNSALLARWQISYSVGVDFRYKFLEQEWSSFQSPVELIKKWGTEETKDKELIQRDEWFGRIVRFRNDAVVISSIICLQFPFELAYAHLYEVISSDLVKFGLTSVYTFAIQCFTQMGGKVSVGLIKCEKNKNVEYRSRSLVYKVFGLYFMQTYIGIFYHALLHRNFMTLRKVLIQRLIVSEVLQTLIKSSLPYLKYKFRKYRAIRNKKKREKSYSEKKNPFISRVEKEYLKPSYSASIGAELEDGLFDEILELALQFGMIMMFACAFPLAFAFAALTNIMRIRAEALKLLVMVRRPIPRAAASIGAWINIFQFLIVMSICTNCILLVCLYDKEREWNMSPGLVAILVMEHILLLVKVVFSRIVPEEPEWVRANRVKNATQAQDICSKQLLRSISGGERSSSAWQKNE